MRIDANRLGPVLVCLAAATAFAADAPLFPRPNWFVQHFGAVRTRVDLEPAAHIADHIVDGKIELSLKAFIELALDNSTDIALARLQVQFPANAVTRAYSVFDPSLQASFTRTQSTAPTTSALQGASTLTNLSQPVDFTYQQFLPTGTSLTVRFDAERDSSNNSFSTYNPALSSSLALSFDHPLLRGSGGSIAKRTILIARANQRQSLYQLRDQVGGLLAQAENAYWDVVEARENVALQAKFLELRQAALDRAQKQANAGALLPLDVYQPRSEYASAQVATIQARQLLAHRENALRQLIGADLDPKTRSLPLVLTEPFAMNAVTLPDREAAVNKALSLRNDRLAVATAIETDDLAIRNANESLRPSLSLTGSYVAQGVGGIYHQLSDPFGAGTAVASQIPGGLGDALGQLFGFSFPVYSLGVRLRLPLRDRAAAADLADSVVRKRLDALQLRKLEQNLRLQVLNAIDDLDAVKASMQQADVAREFAEKRFTAEQKKYELGVQQLFFVLDAQTQLNLAENDVLREAITYRRSLINFYLMTGELLDQRGVVLE